MQRDMYEICVNTKEGLIEVSGRRPGDDEYSGVVFPPDQVDILIQWLQEAKKAIEAGEPD